VNLYRISQTVNDGYDTYDAAIVAAPSVTEARKVHPEQGRDDPWAEDRCYTAWAKKPSDVKVELIGLAKPGTEAGVILASFNAG
jgi:hypothetical protein